MNKILLAIILLTTFSCVEKNEPKIRSGRVSINIDLSESSKNKNAEVWILKPVSSDNQKISSVAINGAPVGQSEYIHAEWDKNNNSKKLTFNFDVESREIRFTNLKSKGEVIPEDIKPFLAPSKFIPTDGKIKEIAEQAAKNENTILGKARAIYDWVVMNTKRDPDVRGCGVGIVEQTITKLSGKCADLSSVYVSMARAVGVPSREVFGLRLGKKNDQDMTGGYHCWAEFFLPGTGWVPVDPSDVRKYMLTEKKELSEVKELREYYFGSVDQYRVALKHGGRGIVLAPPQKDQPINYLMYPYAEVDGKALDYFEPGSFKFSVHFNEI